MAGRTQASSENDTSGISSAREATQIVLAARKTWKLTGSKREKVWPPFIEAALVEALQKYRPDSDRDIQFLQRFPKRNCWISNYIKRRTGYDRSPKQVGSRLQQLRESCSDERILKLLSRKQYDDDNESFNSRGSSALSNSASPCSSSSVSASSPDARSEVLPKVFVLESKIHTVVRIELTNAFPHSGTLIPFDTMVPERETGPTLICLDLKLASLVTTVFSWRIPLISLRCSRLLDVTEHHCLFKVFVDGVVVHLERTQIVLQSTMVQTRNRATQQTFIYETRFLPNYWSECFPPSNMPSCEVHQCFVKRRPISDDDLDFLSLKEHLEDEVVHTVRYTFIDLRSSTPSDEPAGPCVSLSNEANEPRSTANSIRAADALGLDAPAILAKPESSADGRAHFPVKEELSSGLQECHSFSPSPCLFQYSSEGITTLSIQGANCLNEPQDCTQVVSYEFPRFRSPTAGHVPTSVNPSKYTAEPSIEQYSFSPTILQPQWHQQNEWTEQAQEYYQQHPSDDKRYVYFWEQPISNDHSSYGNGYFTPLNSTPAAPQTQEMYDYAQPDHTGASLAPTLVHSDDFCRMQDDQNMRNGSYVVHENISITGTDMHNGLSSNDFKTYSSDIIVTSPGYFHYGAPENDNDHQTYAPAQVWD